MGGEKCSYTCTVFMQLHIFGIAFIVIAVFIVFHSSINDFALFVTSLMRQDGSWVLGR